MEKYSEFKKKLKEYKEFLIFNELNQFEINFLNNNYKKKQYTLIFNLDFLELIIESLENKNIEKFEKKINEYLELKPFQLYFAGNKSKKSFNSLEFNCNKDCSKCLEFFTCSSIKNGKKFFTFIFSNIFLYLNSENIKKKEVLTSCPALINCKLQYILKNYNPGKHKNFILKKIINDQDEEEGEDEENEFNLF